MEDGIFIKKTLHVRIPYAIYVAGGTRRKLATLLQVSEGAVGKWKNAGELLPENYSEKLIRMKPEFFDSEEINMALKE